MESNHPASTLSPGCHSVTRLPHYHLASTVSPGFHTITWLPQCHHVSTLSPGIHSVTMLPHYHPASTACTLCLRCVAVRVNRSNLLQTQPGGWARACTPHACFWYRMWTVPSTELPLSPVKILHANPYYQPTLDKTKLPSQRVQST